MKLFEQFDAPDYVIQVAHIALDLAPPDDSNIVSTVYSVTSLLNVCGQWRSWPVCECVGHLKVIIGSLCPIMVPQKLQRTAKIAVQFHLVSFNFCFQ